MLATGGDCVKLWDLVDFSLQHTIPPQSSGAGLKSLSWSTDGNCLASVCEDSQEVDLTVVKGTSALALPQNVKGLRSKVSDIAYANKAVCYLAVAESSGSILLWDVKKKQQKKSYSVKGQGGHTVLSSVVFSPSDSHIAVGTDAGSVHLLSVTTNTVTGPHQLFDNKSPVTGLSYSSVRRGVLGAACAAGGVCYINVNSGRVSHFNTGHSAPCTGLAFSPVNELLFVSVGYDKKMIYYNVNTLKTAQIVTCDAPLTGVTFLPGGLKVCASTLTGEVVVHDLRSLRTPVHRWKAHASQITALALQPAHSVPSLSGSSKKLSSQHKSDGTTPAYRQSKNTSSEVFPSNPTVSTSPCGSQQVTPALAAKGTDVASHSDLMDTSELFSPVRDSVTTAATGAGTRAGKTAATLLNSEKREGVSGTTDEAYAASFHDYEEDSLLSPVKDDQGRLSLSMKMLVTQPAAAAAVLSSQQDSTTSQPAPASQRCDLNATPGHLMLSEQHLPGDVDYEDELLSPVRDSATLTPASYHQLGLPTTPAAALAAMHHTPRGHGPVTRDGAASNKRTTPAVQDSVVRAASDSLARDAGGDGSCSPLKAATSDCNKENEEPATSAHLSLPTTSGHAHQSDGHLSVQPRLSLNQSTSHSSSVSPRNDPRCSTTAASSQFSIQELQKKYNSIVSRMNTENLMQQQSKAGPQQPQSTASGTPQHNASAVPGTLDMERLADLVADRLTAAGVSSADDTRSTHPPGAASDSREALSMSLVRSCVSDVMDELEAGMNRRFTHLQYMLLTLLMQQTREIEELHKKYSVNEELLEDNLRLQEEVKYLRAQY